MESEEAANEEALFSNLPDTRVTFTTASQSPDEVAELDNVNLIGPAISLSVGAGDTIRMEGYAYFEGGSGYSGTTSLGSFIASVAGAFGGLNGGTPEQQVTFDAFDNAYGILGMNGSADDNVPAAYLNYIFFDDDMVYKQSGFKQISGAADFSKEYVEFPTDIVAPKSGFIYCFVSMESATGRVFWDDFKVTVNEHPVVQRSDYYPFGLQHDGGYERVTAKENKFLNTGKERITDLDPNWDDFGARFYDPAIARWTTLDQKAYRGYQLSPYNYSFNNPVRYVDPDGNWPWESKTVRQARRFARATGGKFDKNSRGTRQRTGQSATVNINGTSTGSLVRKNLFGVYGTESLTSKQIDQANLIGFNEGTNYGFLFEKPEYMLANVAVGLNGLSRVVFAIPGLQSLFMNSDGTINIKALSAHLLQMAQHGKNNNVLDDEQVGNLEQLVKDGTVSKKEINAAKRKLKAHYKGTGQQHSRQSKDKKKPKKKKRKKKKDQ